MNSLHNIIKVEETGSTNDDLTKMASEGCKARTILVAEQQNNGKGRRGRNWHSPKGTSLSFSILLRPKLEPQKASMITLLMAMSVWDALCPICNDVKIKWPNDIVIGGKKVCGILTQMRMDGTSIKDVIVGTGINVNQEEIPNDLQQIATSLYLETGKKVSKTELLEHIICSFWKYYEMFLEKKDLSFIQDEYNKRLVNLRKEVKVLDPAKEFTGIALGINEAGELLVEDENKEIHTVYAGEVSVRGVYGYV